MAAGVGAGVGADVDTAVVEAVVEIIPAAAAQDASALTRAFLAGPVCSGDALSTPSGSLLVRLRPSLTETQHGQFFLTLVRTDDLRFALPRSIIEENDRSTTILKLFLPNITHLEDRHRDRVDLKLPLSANDRNV